MAKIKVEKVLEHLRDKWGSGKRCPMCDSPDWSVQESTFEIRDWHPHAVMASGRVILVVPVICNNCGNTVLVNAIAAGIVTPDGVAQQ